MVEMAPLIRQIRQLYSAQKANETDNCSRSPEDIRST
jgi:hypothetical protein